MNYFTVCVAGHNIAIQPRNVELSEHFAQYLSDERPEYTVCITEEDICNEREKYIRELGLEGISFSELPRVMYEFTAAQRKIADILIDRDIILFHGSVVAVDGTAYLFTAKSGTGKSTHTRLWRELFRERAVMVDDDKPFLHISGDGVTVYGTPWNGKHRLGNNISLPLGGICLLERGAENRIEPVRPSDTLGFIVQQTHRPPSARKTCKYLELLNRLTACMRFWRMECNMDPQAAVVSYEAMSGKRKEESDED